MLIIVIRARHLRFIVGEQIFLLLKRSVHLHYLPHSEGMVMNAMVYQPHERLYIPSLICILTMISYMLALSPGETHRCELPPGDITDVLSTRGAMHMKVKTCTPGPIHPISS